MTPKYFDGIYRKTVINIARHWQNSKWRIPVILACVLLSTSIFSTTVLFKGSQSNATTSGTSKFYFHKESAGNFSTTYNSMGPTPPEASVFRAIAGNGSTDKFSDSGLPPCESAGATDPSYNQIPTEMDAIGDYCIVTLFSPKVGQTISVQTSDTNSITATAWGLISGNGVARPQFRIHQYDDSAGTYPVIADISGTTQFGTSSTQSSVTGTPSNNRTLDPDDRFVVVLICNVTTADSTGGQDTCAVQFDHQSAAAALTVSYTIITPSKPDLTGGNDDDFNPGTPDSANCSSSAPSGWTCGTTNGSWNRASDATQLQH